MKRSFIWFLVVPILVGFVLCCENGTPNYIGTWTASNVEAEPGAFVDVTISLKDDGAFENLVYMAGTTTLISGSARGTYEVEGDLIIATITEEYESGAWQSANFTSTSQFSISGDTMTMSIDTSDPQDGVYDLTVELTRQD
jgi:hypothetical protein